jgi:eukaryotic-like serine/threonine-protein kinase
MPLTSGSRIGAYDIVGSIGAGGMGEVYRARDAKLNRDVAIKVLPELFARDPERLSRFEREAQALAALNHPAIAQIFGVVDLPGNAGGHALVMEFVEGEDLAQRISRGAIPIDDALALAKQIASALEAAHERGIVHRDLKPANVKVTPDGTVKVLDFGLAKMADPADAVISNSPTFTSPATAAGVIIGTAAYMAPEQARGKAVDRRADIWAFGCLVYEMLTGRHAFGGDTVTDTLSAIVSREPDLTALPAGTPPAVRRLIARCLEKDPRKRLQAIGEARIVLDDTSAPEPVTPARASGIPPIAAGGLAIAGAVLGAFGIWLATRPASVATPPPIHLSLSLAPARGLDGSFSLSPDGQTVAFVGIAGTERQIFVRRLDREEAVPLAGTQGGAGLGPIFSPDGKFLAFMSGNQLKKVSVDGGPVTALATDLVTGTRLAWSVDGTIIFTNDRLSLSRVPAAGGAAQPLTKLDAAASELTHEMPWFAPDGKTLLFDIRKTTASASSGATMIVALTLASGEKRELFPGMVLGAVGTNRLIIQRDEAILAVPFDFTLMKATGDPAPFLSLRPSLLRMVYADIPLIAVASNGTVVVSPTSLDAINSPLLMVAPGGQTTRLSLPVHRYSDPRVSPDGTRIAVHVFEEMRDNWIADLRRGTFMRLTFDAGEDETPSWSPDGRWVYWTASRANKPRVIFRKAADGTGAEQEIWKGTAHIHVGGITPDGTTVIISTPVGQATQILAVNVADGKEKPLVTTPFTNEEPAISPDGKWLAYSSNESGRKEVYVQPYPSLQGRAQISAAGGAQPVWARKGSRLYYRGSDKIMAVDVVMKNGIEASAPKAVMDDTYESTQSSSHTCYDVTPDGRFLMVAKPPAAQGSVTHLKIIYAGR